MTEEQKSVVVTEAANGFKRVTTQLSSGKWLLTIAAAFCLLMMVYTDCKVAIKQFEAMKPIVMPFDITSIMGLLVMITTSYFHANKDNNKDGA